MIKQKSAIKNFWIFFFACVAVLATGVAVFVGIVSAREMSLVRMSVIDDENVYKISQENSYRQALYSACDSMKNLDANLGKAAISTNSGNQAQLLTNVIVHANNITQNLSDLPIAESDNLESCRKFVNQTQDYATYLLKKIADGEKITATERTALANLDNVATGVYNFLQEYAESDSGMFVTNGNGMFNVGALSDSLDEVDEDTFAYEKLIYDGPFSDSVKEKTLQASKALSPEDVRIEAEKIFGETKYLQTLNNKGIWYVFETENGHLLTTSDGRVAEFESFATENDDGAKAANAENPTALSAETCIAKAEDFCRKLGYDVKGVWISKTQDSTTYVNCATVLDGVIVYPDLIKVALDSFDGEIVGCEARAYLLNHNDWDVTFGDVSLADAQNSIDSSLKITNTAKALVEKDGKYYRCFEFQCETGGRQYYVYVDSETGEETEIFKVVQNTEGHTVI